MRAAIFIDGAYLQKQMHTARVNPKYSHIADYLLEPLRDRIPVDLLRCYFYHCPPWMSGSPTADETRRMEAHDSFAAELGELSRWQLRLGKLERRRDGDREYFEQKRVDVLLSCDLVRHSAAGHIQHAILVAGDSDLIPAVRAAQESGVTLTLWCGSENTVHKDLKKISDDVHELNWKKFPAVKPVGRRKKTRKKQATKRQPDEAKDSSEKPNSSSDESKASKVSKRKASSKTRRVRRKPSASK